MVTAIVGGLLGWAFSGALIGWGLVTTAFGAIMLGASLGSLFKPRDMGDFSNSPTYSFGPISNTMSQLVPIPVIYGRCRVAGNIIYQAFDSDKKEKQDIYILIGEGPVTAINSVMANDQDPAALEDCSVTKYLNTTAATHDSRDPNGARPYPDDVALICLTLKAQEKLNGTPTITSIVDGVKVWTPNGFAWSRNPVWIVLDILCHPRYGMGLGVTAAGVYQHPDWERIDYDCAVAAAAYCDEAVSYGPRFQLDFNIDTRRPVRDTLADFLATFRGYLVETDRLQICIDAPVSAYSREITPDNIVEGSFTFWQAADEDVCNRITVDWIDPNNSYERVTDVFQDSTDIADRGVVEKSISLLPVTRAEQVGHMGYYLLKTSLMVRNFCSFGVGLKDCDIMPGEVLTVSFEKFTGWKRKPFRVISVKNAGSDDMDVMTVTCSEYVEDVYDDGVLDVTHHIDTSLTTDYKPNDVTELAITEQLETLQDGSYNLIAKITWTPPASYNSLELWYRYSSEVSWKPAGTLPRGSEEYYLPCTGNIGDTLYVKIYVVSNLGIRSDGQTTSKILHGDLTPPAPPTNLHGAGGFRMAVLTWTDPPDADLDHIEIYRALDRADAPMIKIGSVPRFVQEYIDANLMVLQTGWYKLKAVDVAGNESEYTAMISATSEAIPPAEIPEQSIAPSKLLPQLQKLEGLVKMLAEAGIQNSVNEDENRETAAKATQVLETKVVEGLEAEATARTELLAKVNENTSAITEEQTARAEADRAEAAARETLAAQVGQNAAAITAESAARADADSAESTARELMAAQMGDSIAYLQQLMQVVARTVKITEGTAAPASPQTGDIWKNGSVYKIWNGAEWETVTEEEAQKIIAAVIANYTLTVDVNGNVAGFGITNSNIGGSEFAILADAFKIAVGEKKTIVFQVDDSGNVYLSGNLFAEGVITGEMINAAARIQIGDGGLLRIGAGGIFQLGDGVSDTIVMENGQMRISQVIDGALRNRTMITNVKEGVATTPAAETAGAKEACRVYIPGYFATEPKIIVSISELMAYNTTYKSQNQYWRVKYEGLKHELHNIGGGGNYSFIPIANLVLDAASEVIQANKNSGTVSAGWTSGAVSMPANVGSLIAYASMFSKRGTGAAPNWNRRNVKWRLLACDTSGGSYADISGWKTVSIGDNLSEYRDSSISVNISKSAVWYLKAEFTAEDAGGTFSDGSDAYEYNTGNTTALNNAWTYASASQTSDSNPLLTTQYAVPSGWEVWKIKGVINLSEGKIVNTGNVAVKLYSDNLWRRSGAGSFTSVSFETDITGMNAFTSLKNAGATTAANFTVTAGTSSGNGSNTASIRISGGTITFFLRKKVANTTGAQNNYIFDSATVSLNSRTLLAAGKVNWLAAGA
ncbi:phage tail protein [Cloacibacillus porcorum]|uniref:phage tail protein n=1 Tax=Cloacibacillus porcorum TaxID=1197717 RepID=UPI0022E85429|nr:phage tail protein [Cloacibacillus porcorum]